MCATEAQKDSMQDYYTTVVAANATDRLFYLNLSRLNNALCMFTKF